MFGGLIENEILGEVSKLKYFEMCPGIDEYVPYKDALDFVKNNQGFRKPESPTKFFPKDVMAMLRTDTTLKEVLGDAKYRYYTAVGSHLDRYHGVDAFFECTCGEGDRTFILRVTLDVTTNPSKDKYKADLIVQLPRDGIDPSDENYKSIVSEYERQIKDDLLTKFNQRGTNRSNTRF